MFKFITGFLGLSVLCVSAMGSVDSKRPYDFGDGFDTDDPGRRMISGFSLAPRQGRNGTGALLYERNGGEYSTYGVEIPNPGVVDTVYEAEVWVRGEGLSAGGGQRDAGLICAEFYSGEKYLGGTYPTFSAPDGEWRKVRTEFRLKPGADRARVTLYLRKGYQGKVFFDDLRVKAKGEHASVVPRRPLQLGLDSAKAVLEFHVEHTARVSPRLVCELENGGELRRGEYLVADKRALISFTGLKPGPAKVVVTVIGGDNGKVLSREEFRMTVFPGGWKPLSTFDGNNVMRIDGSPFMPVGIFTITPSRADLERIAAAGFNTVLPYNSTGLYLGKSKTGDIVRLRETLDIFGELNLKMIFSLKDQLPGKRYARTSIDGIEGLAGVNRVLAEELRTHKALLCWYLSDEDSRGDIPVISALREEISAIDPDHPTFTLTYRLEDFPCYSKSGDISGVDVYPVSNPDPVSIASLECGFNAADRAGLPVWPVIQSFNPGVYSAANREEMARFRSPTLEELRAMTLLYAIRGAKAFLFYSDYAIFDKGEKLNPGSSAGEWSKLVDTAAMLRRLEPWLLSGEKAPAAVSSDPRLRVASFSHQGKCAVLLCSPGIDGVSATVRIDGKPLLRSLYGLTVRNADGEYVFKSKGVGGDILIQE